MFISRWCGAGAPPRRRPGSQVRQEQPRCGKELPDSDLRHRERSKREATGPHRSGVGWVLVLVGMLIDAYTTMQAQKRCIYNQLDGVYHPQLQKYLFRVSESLKIETGSQRHITRCPAISCLTVTHASSRVGLDDVNTSLFENLDGKWEGHQWRIQREGFGALV